MEEIPLCRILKRAPWQNDFTRRYDALDGWDWYGEELTPMSEVSESMAQDILEEIENETTSPNWRFNRY